MTPAATASPYLATLLVLGIGSSAQAQGNPRDAEIKTVGAEIRDLIKQLGNPKKWRQAASKLEKMGAKAVEPMVEAITKDGVEKSDRTFRVLRIIEEMGPVAKEGYGVLADSLGQTDAAVFLAMWHTLGTLVPFTDTQGNRNEAQRLLQGAIQTLQALPAADRRKWSAEYSRFTQRVLVDPTAGLKAMIDEVKNGRVHRREVAAEVLQGMGKDAKSAIPALAAALRSATSKNGTIAKPRRPILRTSIGFSQQTDEFPARAARAMIKIAPGDPRCAVGYGWQLKKSLRPAERSRAALQLGSFGKAAKDELPTLIAALEDADKRVRWEVITAIGMLGPTAKAAIGQLGKFVGGDDRAASARAKAAIKQINRE
jgi:hypothetical protein